LYNLGDALRALARESGDEHVEDLVRRCRLIESGAEGVAGAEGEGLGKETGGASEQMEEIEK